MEIESYIQKKQELYLLLMRFIESSDYSGNDLLFQMFDKHEILQDKEKLLFLRLLSKISSNHHRSPYFLNKFEQIFEYLFKENITISESYEIYQIFKENKRILFLLFEKGFIQPNERILSELTSTENAYFYSESINKFSLYLYPVIKTFLDETTKKQFEEKITENYCEIEEFEEKCRIGENDSYICSIIRQDSAIEFISHVNQNKISLSSRIKPSIFETNFFLIQREPTLIEYAAFFGSIQIIRYLKYNEVPLTSSLWIYAVHSNNAELIHFLEENDVKPEEKIQKRRISSSFSYEKVFRESIICHHNDIANYIKDNFLNQEQSSDIVSSILKSLNYSFFPTNIDYIISHPFCSFEFSISKIYFSLTEITIPPSVTSIGAGAFSECSSLVQITIPASVTSIGNSVFHRCSSLKEINIPSSVSSIGNSAFYKCSSLTEISIPSSVSSIGVAAFCECLSLKQITIPSSINSIENYTFSRCSSLSQISIPSSVILIGENAFSECSSLVQVTIPSSVTSIGEKAFSECSSLVQIAIPSSITSFSDGIFSKCTSLMNVIIPSSVTSIGNFAFNECSSLKQITIPMSVTSIKNYSFSKCSSITQITIPSSITSIEKGVFHQCSSLVQIIIPSSITSIGENSFYECSSLTQITIPSSVTSIGDNAFYKCSSLTQITIPSSMTLIGKGVFYQCSSLVQVIIPSSVKSIGENAFYECSSLTQVTIPSSVTSIGKNCFFGCPCNSTSTNKKNLISKILDIFWKK